MDIERLTYLINGYRADQLSIVELRELCELVAEDAGGRQTVPILQSMLEQQAPGTIDRDRSEVLLRKVLASDKPALDSTRRVVAMRRWITAASIVLAVGGLILWRGDGSRLTAPKATTMVKTDVQPGGNKAILTLAGGKKLVLDSLHSGLVAQQGGTQVIKLADGQVAYRRADTSIVQYNTLMTPRGGQYRLELSDGTLVWLNASSSITYPTVFKSNQRQVTVTGEAYLEVSHRAAQPFIVKAGKEEVEVLGTSFNINAYPDETAIRTTLIEGAVRIIRDKESLLLKPGEQSQESLESPITLIKDANVEAVMAWRNGLFNFDGADLKTVLRQLSRWYDVDVVYEGEPVARKFMGEMSRDLTLSQVLQGFGEMHLKFKIEGKTLIVAK